MRLGHITFMLHRKTPLAEHASAHEIGRCGAGSAAPHLGRFLPKLGGTSVPPFFILVG